MSTTLKKALKWIAITLAGLLVVVVVLLGWFAWSRTSAVRGARAAMAATADTLRVDGLAFRDLNRNGALDPYEDRRLPTGARVEDLLERMTLEEKAGQLFQTFLTPGEGGEIAGALMPMNLLPVEVALFEKHMSFFNLFETGDAEETARWTNTVQRLAERTRLGIPVTFSSDPRHGAVPPQVVAAFSMPDFSPWPDPLGLAALGDSDLVEEFGRIAAREYRAVGFHMALHPMADLATDPRWARISGTFGEDAELAARLTAAYVRGFQGDTLGSGSVATVTKHFPGGGPQDDGWDPHFRYGKDQVYPGDNFDYHLIPFRAAIDAGTALIMPYYGVAVGQTSEDVGFGFNREIVTDLLRDSLGYDGIVLSDWTLLTPPKLLGMDLERIMPFAGVKDYGVERLTPTERTRKALEAGVDQFGGESSPEYMVRLVREGAVPESRLDASVRRLLSLKYDLGLFDDPYVDVGRVSGRVGAPEARRLGESAQRRSQVLLTNRTVEGEPALPLTRGARIYVRGLDSALAARYGSVVATPDEADVAILGLEPAAEPVGDKFATFHEGRLYYTDQELAPVLDVARRVPTVVSIYLDRPLVIPGIAEAAAAVMGHFGATDAAILDVLFGEASPEGKLPFEMPGSWESVLEQKEDVPFDSGDPLFPFGHGLQYPMSERSEGSGQPTVRSTLATVEITSGRIDTVYSERRHFEAPNWTPDGRYFIVNSEGRLYRLPAQGGGGLEAIPTGFATRLNNDHGLSPDGDSLVISHAAEEHITAPDQAWLASSIYVLPVEGSPSPRKVTVQAPSFWHGWSPDGATLVYTALRDDAWDIYAIPVAGGEERRLTTCPGLDDGPDYSPDGAFIYYNSFCSGRMEIWRMRPDGGDAEQLTDDGYSNWFPHPSPDGRWVVFIAYLEDQGEAHPFGRQVKLRLMDARTGSLRDLTAPFFGGQGTLNVPSWSPDSRRVAFVVYDEG